MRRTWEIINVGKNSFCTTFFFFTMNKSFANMNILDIFHSHKNLVNRIVILGSDADIGATMSIIIIWSVGMNVLLEKFFYRHVSLTRMKKTHRIETDKVAIKIIFQRSFGHSLQFFLGFLLVEYCCCCWHFYSQFIMYIVWVQFIDSLSLLRFYCIFLWASTGHFLTHYLFRSVCVCVCVSRCKQ